jgi:hypothetical protein
VDDFRRGLIRAEIADRIARARIEVDVAAGLAGMDDLPRGTEPLREGLSALAAQLRALQESVTTRVAGAGDEH